MLETKNMKKQAQELIDQVYRRGFNAGYEKGKGGRMNIELKPCPFCGSKALTRSVDGGCLPSFMDIEKQSEIWSKTPYVTTCTLSCDECGAAVQGYAATDDLTLNDIYDKAVENCYQKWNRRDNDANK